MNKDDKIKFIYNKLKIINENKNNIIYNYIIDNRLKHSANKNGLIINLSILNEKDINYFYDLISIVENNESLFNINDNNIIEYKSIIKKEKQEEEDEIIYKNIKLNQLENKILSYI